MKLLFLVSCVGLLGLAQGNAPKSRECRTGLPHNINSIELRQLVGLWHLYSKFDSDTKSSTTEAVCTTFNFTLSDDGNKIKIKESTIYKLNEPLRINLEYVAKKKPSTRILQLDDLDIKYEFLNADFNDYVMFYSCSSLDESSDSTDEDLVVLSRNPTVTAANKRDIDNAYASAIFRNHKVAKVTQDTVTCSREPRRTKNFEDLTDDELLAI